VLGGDMSKRIAKKSRNFFIKTHDIDKGKWGEEEKNFWGDFKAFNPLFFFEIESDKSCSPN
jgi:hypothetical protein